MRKTFFIWVCAVSFFSGVVFAQNDTDRMKRMEQRLERQADRMAEEFDLKGEVRTEFLELYKTYRKEMMKHSSFRNQEHADAKKMSELSEEEAVARIQAGFERKAQAIVDSYNRLEVEKKYHGLFSKMLTSKQMLKIFAPERDPRFGGPGMQRGGNRGGGMQRGGGFPSGGGFNDMPEW